MALIENLQQQRTSMAPSDHEPGRIIGAAVPPSAPSGPGLLITVAGAAMAGLLLGVAAAVLRERLDPWVRSADRLELAAGPLAVVSSEHSDEQFWVRLADEAVRRARVDPACEPVRVLLHAAAPMPSRIAAGRLLAAVRWILDDPGTGLSWGGTDAAAETAAGASTGCAVIVPSGRYRTSLVSAARRSDVAVIAATPRTALKDLTELVSALRECGIEVVIGLAEAPVPAAVRRGERSGAPGPASPPRHRHGAAHGRSGPRRRLSPAGPKRPTSVRGGRFAVRGKRARRRSWSVLMIARLALFGIVRRGDVPDSQDVPRLLPRRTRCYLSPSERFIVAPDLVLGESPSYAVELLAAASE